MTKKIGSKDRNKTIFVHILYNLSSKITGNTSALIRYEQIRK